MAEKLSGGQVCNILINSNYFIIIYEYLIDYLFLLIGDGSWDKVQVDWADGFPKQKNDFHCGLYLLRYLYCIACNDPIRFSAVCCVLLELFC